MTSCCFIGHRNAVLTAAQQHKLTALLQYLIVERNVDVFAFGSRSTFNSLCHKVVTGLKQIYPHISRKCFTCSHETCTLQEDVDSVTAYRRFTNLDMVLPMDEEVYHSHPTGRHGTATYCATKQWWITRSTVCFSTRLPTATAGRAQQLPTDTQFNATSRSTTLRCSFAVF